jgi:K+-transporting ATPase ATPase A chain
VGAAAPRGLLIVALGDFLTLAVLAAAVLLITPLLGRYIHRVMEGERTFLSPALRPVERAIYRVSGIDETSEQDWKGYTISVLVMAVVAIAAGYLVLRLQGVLPLNQGGIPAMTPDLALNTSVSFETNTNWQNYSGETGATYLTQAAVLAVRNFTSAATGLAVAIALIRGLTRRSTRTLGNYWVDLTRGVLYLLLPISIVGALVLVWQGVPQTWNPSQTVTTLQGAQQTIAIGPIASQEWIKQLGNNGGGFLNANSAHPFESPTGLTNWLGLLAILAVPFSLTYTFGRYAGNQRQGWTIFGAMAGILVVGIVVAMLREAGGNPLFPAAVSQALGNMEGKEVRFGAAVGGLFAAVTTGTSTGAVNAVHDSLQPLSGLVPLFNMELGEVTPGGIVAGMYGMLVIGAILAVFIAGLMVGRTPEYLGKKVESFEIKMAMLVALVLGASILGFTAIASVLPEGQAGPLNTGPHGFSEILYAFSSQTGNNGSAFAGLSGNTPFYNVTGAIAMLIGRYGMIVPILALAGSMAAKRRVAPSLGTFPTTGILWSVLLVGVVVIVGALTFFPALSLGPIVEQLLQNAGKAF